MLSEHFHRKEFECQCGCGFDTVDHELIVVLEDIRKWFDKPIIINSGARCEKHNKEVGGSDNSQHTKGRAVDFVVVGVSENVAAEYLSAKYLHRYGIGRYNGRTHIDTRTNGPARWDKR